MKRCLTGIKELDELLGGGLPPGDTLLIGPPGCGKTTFCTQFIAEGLKRGEACIYVTVDNSPNYIRKHLKLRGVDPHYYEQKNLLRIIDCYSFKIKGWFPEKVREEYVVSNPADMNELLDKIEKARSEIGPNGRGVIDSLSTLILATHREDEKYSYAFTLLDLTNARVKELETSAIVVLVKGLHDPKVEARARYICEGVIEMIVMEKESALERYIRVSTMKFTHHGTDLLKYRITERGIEIVKD